jgi:hypothetical protein
MTFAHAGNSPATECAASAVSPVSRFICGSDTPPSIRRTCPNAKGADRFHGPPRPLARAFAVSRDTGARQRSSRVFETRSDIRSRAVAIRRRSSVPQHPTAGSLRISATPAPKVKAFPSVADGLLEVCSLGATKSRHFRFMTPETADAPRKSINVSHYVRAPLKRPDPLRLIGLRAGVGRSEPDCSKELNSRV